MSTAEQTLEAVLPNPDSLSPASAHSAGRSRTALSPIDRWFRSRLLNRLSPLAEQGLSIVGSKGEMLLEGNDSAAFRAGVRIHDDRFFRSILFGGALGAAEAYLQGKWSADHLTNVFRLLLQNEETLTSLNSVVGTGVRSLGRAAHWLNRNTRFGSRRNISRHYDLGNEFFRLFLDETMMYSSGIYPSSSSTLKDASIEKIDRICRTLQLTPADHIVEIGTGWGGFALHAAGRYGCRVTTTTISEEQYAMAARRISDAGLQDRVTLLKQDYRDLEGRFDKLVSIEMIEAVGREFLPGYMRQCRRLLKPEGTMMIQAITMPEQRYASYCRGVDFIQKYIFPGGFLPSVTELQECVRRETDLRLLGLTDFGFDYARTLRDWNAAFHDRLDDVRKQGFDERFIRMWRYYLCYCEAAFLERATGVCQLVWGTPQSSLSVA